MLKNLTRFFLANHFTSRSISSFSFKLNRFNDIHVKADDIVKFCNETNSNLDTFETTLKESIQKWKEEKRSAIWLYLPISLAHLASVSSKYGFKYHHAENELAVLYKWLPENKECKIPTFATHQMGVAGVCYRADTKQVLAIKDRIMYKDAWKFPGGAADLGEDISVTAVREVHEETGIQSKFCSVIGFRQQHNYPTAHGRSDLYVICRLEPITYEINKCNDEIRDCKWIDLDKMCSYGENNLSQVVAKLIKYGVEKGFDSIDIKQKHMQSIIPGRYYNFFHRNIDV